MNLKIDENLDPIRDDEKVEPEKLLEECWFFGNLLDRKSSMLRSFSDPCTSSNYNQESFSEKSYEETYESIKKLSGSDEFTGFNLIKAPSMPPSLDRKHQNSPKESDLRRSKSNRKTSSNNLLLAPSLPTSLGIQEFQDEEIEFSMGKLIRQASMNNSDTLPPPKTHAAKGVTPSCSISRHHSRRKSELESIKMEGLEEIRTQRLMNQLKTQKSLSVVESKELHGFKDLGLNFKKKGMNPQIISTITGLQEKKRIEENKEKNIIRPYLSEAWRGQNSASPVLKWGGKKSTEDMKAQIKSWARAVASNVN